MEGRKRTGFAPISCPPAFTPPMSPAGGAFTHTSYNDYEIAADNLSNSDHCRVSDRIQAYALYIDPPLGRVLVAKYPMALVNRAYEKGKT
jgi:hypothetical protein